MSMNTKPKSFDVSKIVIDSNFPSREKNKISNVAIVRIEQLFPLPVKEIKKIISKYNSNEIVWAQEEPRNMGPWGHLLLHLDLAKEFRVASRRFYGSPADGSQ